MPATAPARRTRPVPAPATRAPATLPAAATPPAPASAAPASAAPAATAGAQLVASPEYAASDPTGVVGSISSSVTKDMVGPHVKSAVADVLAPEQFPFLGTTYGEVIPGKVAGVVTGEVGSAIGGIVGNQLRGVLHGRVPGVEERTPGLGWTPTPANALIARLVKGVSTTWMDLGLRSALAPPPPPPPPVYPPDVAPLPPAPVPAPPPPRTVLGQPIAPILRAAATDAFYKTAISALYDQAVGPLVQRLANVLTGRAGEEVKPPTPLTPGKLANGFVDGVVSSLLVRKLTYPAPESGSTTPFSATLGTSILNNIIGAAWSTAYERGVGPSIENGVNQLAGVRSKEDVEKAKLPPLEHFLRAATRGVAVGATTYVVGNALLGTMVRLGGQLGGVGGTLVAIAGAALVGSIGGSLVDATIGPMLGRLGGAAYTWITGRPAYEARATQPSPGPTPGDPVQAPNGNPGTVPAPAPAAAPAAGVAPAAPAAAPAAGKPRRRRPTGDPAVDRTAPARTVPNARLVSIAARS